MDTWMSLWNCGLEVWALAWMNTCLKSSSSCIGKTNLQAQGCRQTEAIAQASGIGNTICVLFVYSSSLFAGCVNNVGLEGPNAWKLWIRDCAIFFLYDGMKEGVLPLSRWSWLQRSGFLCIRQSSLFSKKEFLTHLKLFMGFLHDQLKQNWFST